MKWLLVVAHVSWLGLPPSISTSPADSKEQCETMAKRKHQQLNGPNQKGTARVWCHPIKYPGLHAYGWPKEVRR